VVWLVIGVIPTLAGLNADQWHYFAAFAALIAGLMVNQYRWAR
jgi:citrate:succinate antiporter/L-tartrate/succinate antiporter